MPPQTTKFTAWGDPTRAHAAPIAPAPAAVEPQPHSPEAEQPASRRLGVPLPEPVESQPLAERSSLLLRRERDDEIEEDIAASLETPDERGPLAQLLRLPGVVAILVVVSALVMLFAAAQAMTFVNELAALPVGVRQVGYVGVGILAGAVVLAVGRLVWLYARLRSSPRVSLQAIRALREREELRELSLAHLGAARTRLRDLLRTYPVAAGADERRLLALGLDGNEVEHLRRTRKRLLEEERGGDEAWLDAFNRQFLSAVDAAARRRVGRYSRIVFLKTTVLPRGSLDTLAVLFNAYRMVGDLCRLYNVRAGKWDTGAILVRIVTNALLASRLEDWTGSIADYTTDALTQHAHDLAAGLAIKVTGKMAAGVTDGAANALLTQRLGVATIRYLRPVREIPNS